MFLGSFFPSTPPWSPALCSFCWSTGQIWHSPSSIVDVSLLSSLRLWVWWTSLSWQVCCGDIMFPNNGFNGALWDVHGSGVFLWPISVCLWPARRVPWASWGLFLGQNKYVYLIYYSVTWSCKCSDKFKIIIERISPLKNLKYFYRSNTSIKIGSRMERSLGGGCSSWSINGNISLDF